MPTQKKSLPEVALIQLGPEIHSALNALAKRNGETKSEIVRRALRGFARAQGGFWEEVLIELNIILAEMTEEAAASGMMEPQQASELVNKLDKVRQHLYGRLDEIDGFPSIHWTPRKGDEVRSHADVRGLRAQRGALVEPELERIRSLADRFINESHSASRDAKLGTATSAEVDLKNGPSR